MHIWLPKLNLPTFFGKYDETHITRVGNLLNGPPPLKQLLDFIARRCEVFETTTRASSAKKIEAKSQPNVKRSSCAATVKPKCNFCQGEHVIYYCKNFVALPIWITGKIPTFSLGRDKFNFPRNIRLADPRFHILSDIDLLIGMDLFWNLICVGQVKFSDKHSTLQKTRLGWILAGHLDSIISITARVHSLHASVTNAELHEHVSRAWQMDDISTQSHNFTMEENICDSRESALKRLKGIERRFMRDLTLKSQYAAFLDEYVSLGHMKKSKIRVVFDAFWRNSSGVSLNDALLVGPAVQQDLISILMRFRFFTYVTADIIKMYRRILMHPP
ncbi:hypothetical protein ALC53_01880 [Atta colombica]|uniref:Peptidase aspartic putative domain-containing protein n=1 Tax=Atta colombica TaxID=520822 RepID=A0A151I5M5_9HYME|nr:hypothetical protein ALC53_01880 [Atta colombica]